MSDQSHLPPGLETRRITASLEFWAWIDALGERNNLPWEQALYHLIRDGSNQTGNREIQ